MNKAAVYDEMYSGGRGNEWDQAPGKKVILNAFQALEGSHGKKIVCDIGCGTGLLLNAVKSLNKFPKSRFIGIDISPTAIDIAQRRYLDLDLRIGDGAKTDFDDQMIDIAVSYGSFEHFDDPGEGVSELARILKPKAKFFLMMPTIEHYWQDKSKEEGWYDDKTGQAQWNFTRSKWESFFKSSRLTLISDIEVSQFGALNPGCFFFGTKE